MPHLIAFFHHQMRRKRFFKWRESDFRFSFFYFQRGRKREEKNESNRVAICLFFGEILRMVAEFPIDLWWKKNGFGYVLSPYCRSLFNFMAFQSLVFLLYSRLPLFSRSISHLKRAAIFHRRSLKRWIFNAVKSDLFRPQKRKFFHTLCKCVCEKLLFPLKGVGGFFFKGRLSYYFLGWQIGSHLWVWEWSSRSPT